MESRFLRATCDLLQQMFIILLVIYLLLLLAETTWEESISGVLNLNYLLIGVVVLGIPAVLTARDGPSDREKEPIRVKNILISACAGIVGAVMVWYQTKYIGWVSTIMSIVSFALILILSLLILREGDEGEDSQDK